MDVLIVCLISLLGFEMVEASDLISPRIGDAARSALVSKNREPSGKHLFC